MASSRLAYSSYALAVLVAACFFELFCALASVFIANIAIKNIANFDAENLKKVFNGYDSKNKRLFYRPSQFLQLVM